MTERRKLPDTRPGITHHFRVGEHSGDITLGYYPDQTLGEVFITMSREGSTIGGMLDSFALLLSLALQHGVPLELLVKHFSYQRFEPCGHSDNPDIGFAYSIIDYIFRWLGQLHAPKAVPSQPDIIR